MFKSQLLKTSSSKKFFFRLSVKLFPSLESQLLFLPQMFKYFLFLKWKKCHESCAFPAILKDALFMKPTLFSPKCPLIPIIKLLNVLLFLYEGNDKFKVTFFKVHVWLRR